MRLRQKLKKLFVDAYEKLGNKYVLFLAAGITCLNIIIGSIFLYIFEHSADNALIQHYMDAVWMNWMVSTTVGFGDYYPITTGGKIVTGLSSLIGIGMFGLVTSIVSGMLMTLGEKKKKDQESVHNAELREQNARIEENQKKMMEAIQFLLEQKESSNSNSNKK